MNWKEKARIYIYKEIENAPSLFKKYKELKLDLKEIGIHLAVFSEPYMSLLFSGEKKIESRFSKNRISPFNKISPGDIIIVKKSGGAIYGFFIAGTVKYFNHPHLSEFERIKKSYSKDICADYDPNFWDDRLKTSYITLLKIEEVRKTELFYVDKKDRTAWTVIQPNTKMKHLF